MSKTEPAKFSTSPRSQNEDESAQLARRLLADMDESKASPSQADFERCINLSGIPNSVKKLILRVAFPSKSKRGPNRRSEFDYAIAATFYAQLGELPEPDAEEDSRDQRGVRSCAAHVGEWSDGPSPSRHWVQNLLKNDKFRSAVTDLISDNDLDLNPPGSEAVVYMRFHQSNIRFNIKD